MTNANISRGTNNWLSDAVAWSIRKLLHQRWADTAAVADGADVLCHSNEILCPEL